MSDSFLYSKKLCDILFKDFGYRKWINSLYHALIGIFVAPVPILFTFIIDLVRLLYKRIPIVYIVFSIIILIILFSLLLSITENTVSDLSIPEEKENLLGISISFCIISLLLVVSQVIFMRNIKTCTERGTNGIVNALDIPISGNKAERMTTDSGGLILTKAEYTNKNFSRYLARLKYFNPMSYPFELLLSVILLVLSITISGIVGDKINNNKLTDKNAGDALKNELKPIIYAYIGIIILYSIIFLYLSNFVYYCAAAIETPNNKNIEEVANFSSAKKKKKNSYRTEVPKKKKNRKRT